METLEALKVGGVQREEKGGKTCFVRWKVSFFSFFFLIIPFHLHFKDDL
jgi:hypothetical protein